jgi:hypothetical protein
MRRSLPEPRIGRALYRSASLPGSQTAAVPPGSRRAAACRRSPIMPVIMMPVAPPMAYLYGIRRPPDSDVSESARSVSGQLVYTSDCIYVTAVSMLRNSEHPFGPAWASHSH